MNTLDTVQESVFNQFGQGRVFKDVLVQDTGKLIIIKIR